MVTSNFSTETYDDKQLQNNLMIISNFRMESYDGKQLQY